MHAVRANNETASQALIDAAAEVNSADDKGNTALILGAIHRNEKIISDLIKAGACVNYKGRCQKTALIHAVENNMEIATHTLIDAGAEVNTADDQGKTALILGTVNGNEKIVSDLIKAGADVNYKDKFKRSAVIYSLRNISLVEAIPAEKLIDTGSDVNSVSDGGKTALIWASAFRKEKAVHTLINVEADVNLTDDIKKTPLMYSVQSCQELIRDLIEGEFDIIALFERFLDGNYMHRIFSRSYDPELTHILETFTGVREKFSIPKALIAAGASINATDTKGRSALMLAAQAGYVESLRLLIESGGDVNIKDSFDKTAVMYAIDSDNKVIVEALLDAGAKITKGTLG